MVFQFQSMEIWQALEEEEPMLMPAMELAVVVAAAAALAVEEAMFMAVVVAEAMLMAVVAAEAMLMPEDIEDMSILKVYYAGRVLEKREEIASR